MASEERLDLDLVVAWRAGRNLHAGPVDISGEVARNFAVLLDPFEATLQNVQSLALFDPDVEYGSDDPTPLRAGVDVLVDSELLDVLRTSHVNDSVTGEMLKDRRARLYAVTRVENDRRVIYVRASSPVKFAEKSIKGRLTDSFDLIAEPILVFDDRFDFIIDGDELVILNPSAFERITNSPESARAASERLTEMFSGNLTVDVTGQESLREYLRRNSFARRKMVSLNQKSYLRSLTVELLSTVLKEHSLPREQFIVDEALAFTPENAKNFLALLNDDVFAGDFSGVEYAAARKSAFS